MYKKLRLDIRYPANVKREQIFVKPKKQTQKIIDVIGGAGMPLIDIKERFCTLLVMTAKICYRSKRKSKKDCLHLCFADDFENPKKVKNNSGIAIKGCHMLKMLIKHLNQKKLKKNVD